MAKKFIPSGDSDFADMAQNFATPIAQDPARYHVSVEEAQSMQSAVNAFREALASHCPKSTRSKATRMRKDEARAVAVRLIQDAANRIRVDRTIDAISKMLITVKEKPARLRRRACPQTPPVLYFAGSRSGGWNAAGMHMLRFIDQSETKTSKAKPAGAVRIELFVDLVAPGQPMPTSPGQHTGGWPRYLRSFSRSPITVQYPKLEGARSIVYWARWADATGETGPFSRPLVASLDTWTAAPPSLPAPEDQGQLQQRVTVTSARRELPDCVETFQTMTARRTQRLPPPQTEAA